MSSPLLHAMTLRPKLEMAQGAESKVEGLQAELAQAVSERDEAQLQLQKEQSRAEELEKQVGLCVCACVCVRVRVCVCVCCGGQ